MSGVRYNVPADMWHLGSVCSSQPTVNTELVLSVNDRKWRITSL